MPFVASSFLVKVSTASIYLRLKGLGVTTVITLVSCLVSKRLEEHACHVNLLSGFVRAVESFIAPEITHLDWTSKKTIRPPAQKLTICNMRYCPKLDCLVFLHQPGACSICGMSRVIIQSRHGNLDIKRWRTSNVGPHRRDLRGTSLPMFLDLLRCTKLPHTLSPIKRTLSLDRFSSQMRIPTSPRPRCVA